MIGGAIFRREALAVARRPRTYALQTIFLAGLVAIVIPFWPTEHRDGGTVSDAGRAIFQYGTYLELCLMALLAPTATAGAITVEKSKNTLGLLLITNAGPISIVFGKLLARTAALAFLQALSMPIIFAILTLGGIDARQVGVAFVLLLSVAWLGGAIGIFLSTVLRRTPMALMGGYVLVAAYMALPALLELGGIFHRMGARGAGTIDPAAPLASPFFDLMYLFEPHRFVASESFPSRWWVNPALNGAAGLTLALLAGLLLPASREIERAFDLRRSLERLDALLARLMPGGLGRKVADVRPGPTGNPIFWKETTVNTLGRFRYWWRVNAGLTALLGLSYWVFRDLLQDIHFHQVVCATLSSVLILASTVISANAVAKEREDRTLEVLATTPIDCATYVQGKVRGILRNIIFLLLLPLFHVLVFTVAGPIHVASLIVLIAFPVAAVVSIQQGILVSLIFPTTLRAILAAILVVVFEATLPFCCCLPSFNLPLLGYFAIAGDQSGSRDFGWALIIGTIFSTGAHVGLLLVTYSLIRSGFDRYIGRAG